MLDPAWQTVLHDERSRRVAFVSHCLLNQNVRYLGGAFRPTGVSEVLAELERHQVGIVQMPCPEQAAWGGVLKRWVMAACGHASVGVLEPVLVPAFLWYTRLAYRRLARRVARQVADYLSAGYTVVGILGVDGSPSCGVKERLNLSRSFRLLVALDVTETDRGSFNRELLEGCAEAGQGFFMQALAEELRRRGLEVPFLSHSLREEAAGIASSFRLRPPSYYPGAGS